ncbi:MAG: SDR family oxidoreductase [Gemmatimonadetes bacterium]|nr:SDR family oxidoreductase [Gemmatimonadota bacterium]MCB9505315.1 SDR family oxidoreductase [Gemmatimonadales bacterium]MCA9762871.1 SDR family oxidoreductase [Gemmatimonadota bacterium]MCA9768860.1 SDR family oxidoreductase [Gemmatimonadota bacterium]MCB9518023.1 SDR family oxidoreductase [Gemmatimonadales bacterium]
MQGKTCLVTGANRGIGYHVALGLAQRGARVLVHARTAARAAEAAAAIRAESGNDAVEGVHADFLHQAEVRALAAQVHERTDRLHVLVNNAGAYFMYRQTTDGDHEATFAVNHLAPFILTNALVDLLTASAPARVIMVSSEAHQRTGNVEDWESRTSYSGYGAYARSKLANIMFTYDLAHRLEGTGVTVNACHPGVVDTGIIEQGLSRWWTRWLIPLAKRFAIPPAEGAETPLYLATSPEVEGVSAKYFKRKRPATSSLVSHDATIGARLWNISLRYTGQLSEVEITGEHIVG